MVFLGLEQPVAYGRQLVFDPTTAQMVLNANRDYINAVYNDYQQARLDMKDFLKEYGDFLSPILADMDWYEKNISGNIRNFVNSLYELGIDPLRSQLGRALIARKLASLPVQLMSLKRQAAEAAREYVKNRDTMIKAGMWDEDYERHMLGGQTLEEWDNSLGPWKATSASPYMDYEKKYGHLFDKMDYEYDKEESKKHPGMIVMTKNKNRMHDILSASRPDMANDPQYKYDLERIKVANPGISDSDAQNILENEIISRNYKGGMKIEADPYAMLDYKTNKEIEEYRRKKAIDAEMAKDLNNNTSNISGWTDRQKFNVLVNSYIKNKDAAAKSFAEYVKDRKNLTTDGIAVINNNLRQLIADYYNSTMSDFSGADSSGDVNTAIAEFNKGGRLENRNTGTGITKKVTVLSFENRQIRPTAYAQVLWAGRSMTKGSHTRDFSEYLYKNKISGESMGTPTFNHKQSNSGDVYEINRYIKVSMEDLQDWINANQETWRTDFEHMGISQISSNEKIYKPGLLSKNAKFESKDYAIIPVSRRIDERGTGNSSIDVEHDRRQFGTKVASERLAYYVNRDLRRYGKQ